MEILIKGNLKQVLPVIERKDFKTRKIWVDIDQETKYPQIIELEVSGKGLDIFEGVAIGAPVICHINLRGREWAPADGEAKVFNTLQCWRVEADITARPAPASQQGFTDVALPETNDLPF